MIKIGRAATIFLATKLHFEGTYDAFKYNFKLPATQKKFSYHYEKLARMFVKEEDLIFFLFVTFARFDISYIGDLFTDEVTDNYNSAIKFKEGLTYHLHSDIKKIRITDIANGGQGLIRKTLNSELNTMSLVIMADLLDLFVMWKEKYATDPFMSSYIAKVEKLKKIMPYDRNKIAKGIEEYFDQIEKEEKDDNVNT